MYASNKAIPDDVLLGNMVFYSLVDMTLSESDLKSVFVRNNIPESYIRRISTSDAFRRATSLMKTDVVTYTDNNGNVITGHLEVSEIKSNADLIVKIIGVKFKNPDSTGISDAIDYNSIAQLCYNKKNELADYSLSPFVNPAYQSQLENHCIDAITRYNSFSTYHNKETVRNIIVRIMKDIHPVSLMPTGICKFTLAKHKDMIYNLKNLIADLCGYSNEESVMEIIPIIDSADSRALVDRSFRGEIDDEIVTVVTELSNLLTTRSALPTRSINAYRERLFDIEEKAKNYDSMLNTGIDFIKQQILAACNTIDDNTAI